MKAPPLPYNHWGAHLVQNNSVILLSEEVFELAHFTLYIQWGRIAYAVRHQVSETVFSTVSHDMTKVTLTLVSKYKEGQNYQAVISISLVLCKLLQRDALILFEQPNISFCACTQPSTLPGTFDADNVINALT